MILLTDRADISARSFVGPIPLNRDICVHARHIRVVGDDDRRGFGGTDCLVGERGASDNVRTIQRVVAPSRVDNIPVLTVTDCGAVVQTPASSAAASGPTLAAAESAAPAGLPGRTVVTSACNKGSNLGTRNHRQ
jgi:hypothetical protein